MTSSVGRSRANENRRIRQEALREQLAAQKHLEKVIADIDEMRGLADFEEDLDKALREDGEKTVHTEALKAVAGVRKFQLDVLDKAISQRMKIVNKYLPELKAVEHSGEIGSETVVRVVDLTGRGSG